MSTLCDRIGALENRLRERRTQYRGRSATSERLRRDAASSVPELEQRFRRCLDELRRARDVDDWPRLGWPAGLVEQFTVDFLRVAVPAARLLFGQGDTHVDLVEGRDAQELVAVDHLVEPMRGVQEAHRDGAVHGRAVPEDRAQGHDTGSLAYQHQRSVVRSVPDEGLAERPAELELVAHLQLLHEIR